MTDLILDNREYNNIYGQIIYLECPISTNINLLNLYPSISNIMSFHSIDLAYLYNKKPFLIEQTTPNSLRKPAFNIL